VVKASRNPTGVKRCVGVRLLLEKKELSVENLKISRPRQKGIRKHRENK
jgi:hypothetical protein